MLTNGVYDPGHTVSSIFNRKFRPRPHTVDHTRRSPRTREKLHFYMRNHRSARPGHATGGGGGRGEKEKDERKGKEIRIYTTNELPFTALSFTLFEFCGENPSQDLVFTITTNKTGARVRSLARITRYTFAISGSLAAEKTAARVIMRLAGISPTWMERAESDV